MRVYWQGADYILPSTELYQALVDKGVCAFTDFEGKPVRLWAGHISGHNGECILNVDTLELNECFSTSDDYYQWIVTKLFGGRLCDSATEEPSCLQGLRIR